MFSGSGGTATRTEGPRGELRACMRACVRRERNRLGRHPPGCLLMTALTVPYLSTGGQERCGGQLGEPLPHPVLHKRPRHGADQPNTARKAAVEQKPGGGGFNDFVSSSTWARVGVHRT